MRNFSWFVARRYLASRKQGKFLSFITWIAMGGITVGVTALIVVIGVMNGMQEDLQAKILGASPHVIVLQKGEGGYRLDRWQEVADSIRTIHGVTAVTPWSLATVSAVTTGYTQPAELFGIRLEGSSEEASTDLEAQILSGEYSLGPTDSGLPPILLGSRLAERMQLFVGDSLLVYAVEDIPIDHMGYLSPSMREFEITGIFTTGMYEYDIRNLYAPLDEVQSLLRIWDEEVVSGLSVRIEDHWAATDVAERIEQKLGFNYDTHSWIETNGSLFSALKLEKLVMGLILLLIVLVAAFNIVSTLVMVVVDRTSEIGILKSMGMTDRQVLRIFILQGFTIGLLGTAMGTALGLLLSWVLHEFEIIEIPPDVYFIDRLPVSIHPGDVLLIVVVSLVISLIATIYPALQAASLEPVEAIKDE